MRSSRFAVLVVFVCAVLFTTNCSFYSRIMARKNLVDGSIAYKDRKFEEAEGLFRKAAARDPEGATLEGRTAQLFLARTLHSRYIGSRENKGLAQQAVDEYKKAVPQVTHEYADAKAAYEANKTGSAEQKRYYSALSSVNSTVSAIPSLLDNLGDKENAIQFQKEVAANTQLPETARARALVSMGLEYNTCANDITDTEKTKKTITKDGKQAFQFVKPEKPEDLEMLKKCVVEGTQLTDQAVALETPDVKSATSLNIKSLTDEQLKVKQDALKVFESARSYKASLLIQDMRLAEMENRIPDRDRLKTESEAARANFVQLSDVVKKIQAEMDERTAAKEAETSANKANKAAEKK